jgi:hypothetical protein
VYVARVSDASAPVCENCAREETHVDGLHAVRRVYLELDEWGEQEPKATIVNEVEQWCVSCRTIYPHEDA